MKKIVNHIDETAVVSTEAKSAQSNPMIRQLREALAKMDVTGFVFSSDMRLAVNAGLMSDDHARFLIYAASALDEKSTENTGHRRGLLVSLGLCPECGNWGSSPIELRCGAMQGRCICGTGHRATETFYTPWGELKMVGWSERLTGLIAAAEDMTRKAIFAEVTR